MYFINLTDEANRMTYFSTLTPAEEFKLNGTLSAATQEHLINVYEQSQLDTEGLVNLVHDATQQYPAEDWSCSLLNRLALLKKSLRGNNRETIDSIMDDVAELTQEMFNASEAGLDGLNAAIRLVKEYEKQAE
jgi:hypothetical protein